jgi:hypothetical protein
VARGPEGSDGHGPLRDQFIKPSAAKDPGRYVMGTVKKHAIARGLHCNLEVVVQAQADV